MSSLNHILVPIDFAPCSEAALAQALYLAELFGASLEVVHVWQAPSSLWPQVMVKEPDGTDHTLQQIAELHASEGMQRMLAPSRSRLVRIRQRIESGTAHEVVLRLAEQGRHDLIVMGTHGRTGASHALMGGVAERVVRHARCPVLTVHAPAAPRPSFQRILVPTDFSPGAAAALDFALSLAVKCVAEVDVLHVWDEPPGVAPEALVVHPEGGTQSVRDFLEGEARRGMHAFVEDARRRGAPHFNWRIEFGEPCRVIAQVAREGSYDLLVMGTEGRTGLARFLIGSIAEKVVRCAPCPVVTVRAPSEERPAPSREGSTRSADKPWRTPPGMER